MDHLPFGVQAKLIVDVCEDSTEATYKGYFYREPIYKPIEITKAVVVHEGMNSGNSSVDFILIDKTGQKFVCMITAKLLKELVNVCHIKGD